MREVLEKRASGYQKSSLRRFSSQKEGVNLTQQRVDTRPYGGTIGAKAFTDVTPEKEMTLLRQGERERAFVGAPSYSY